MLAHKVEFAGAVRVRPEEALGAVETGAVFRRSRKVPEGKGHVLAVDPLPVISILGISNDAQPVLAVLVVLMASVELPAEKALKGRGDLIDQRAAPLLAESLRLEEVHLLVVVEDVAVAVVGGGAAQRLVAEGGTLLDGEGYQKTAKKNLLKKFFKMSL